MTFSRADLDRLSAILVQAADAQNANKARTASAWRLLAATEPENVVMISTACGRPPTMVMPGTPSISLSC